MFMEVVHFQPILIIISETYVIVIVIYSTICLNNLIKQLFVIYDYRIINF